MTRGTDQPGGDHAAQDAAQTARYDEGLVPQDDQIVRQDAQIHPTDDELVPDDVIIVSEDREMAGDHDVAGDHGLAGDHDVAGDHGLAGDHEQIMPQDDRAVSGGNVMPGQEADRPGAQAGNGGTPAADSPARVFAVPPATAGPESAAATTDAALAAAGPGPATMAVGAASSAASPGPAATVAAERTSPGVRWHEIQAMFVDDPRTSVELAAGLVDDSTDLHVSSLREHQQALRSAWQDTSADTEELRLSLQQYRAFWNRLEEFSR